MPRKDGLNMAHDTISPLLEALSRDVRELSLGTEVRRVKGPLHPLQFLRDFVMLNRPCIVTDAITHWPALKLWSNQYLCSKLAHQDVSCHFTPDGRADALVNLIADTKVESAEAKREARQVYSCGTSANAEPLKVKREGRQLFSCGKSGEAEPLKVKSEETRRFSRKKSEQEEAISVCPILGENLEADSQSVGQGKEERGGEEIDCMQDERETSQGSNQKLVPVSHSSRDFGASQLRDCIMDELKEDEIGKRDSVRNLKVTEEMDLTVGKGHGHGAVSSRQQDDTDEEEESEKSSASESALVGHLPSSDDEEEDDEEESDDESGEEGEKSEGGEEGEEESDQSDSSKEDVVFASALVETLPFRKALDYIIGTNNDLGVAYTQQQNNCFVSEFSLLSSDADMHISWASEALGCAPEAVNLWIGGKESVTSFHKDHYENLYAVVAGEKHFTLLPPTDVYRMYVRDYPSAHYVRTKPSGISVSVSGYCYSGINLGLNPACMRLPSQLFWSSCNDKDSGELKLERDNSHPTVPWVSVDPFPKPTEWEKARSSFPRYFEGPSPFVCTVRAGELLYLPSLWFHHVRQTPDSEGRTIALNYWYDMQFEMKYAYSNLVESLAATL